MLVVIRRSNQFVGFSTLHKQELVMTLVCLVLACFKLIVPIFDFMIYDYMITTWEVGANKQCHFVNTDIQIVFLPAARSSDAFASKSQPGQGVFDCLERLPERIRLTVDVVIYKLSGHRPF